VDKTRGVLVAYWKKEVGEEMKSVGDGNEIGWAFDKGGRFISSADPLSILPNFSKIWGLRLRFLSAIVSARTRPPM
jgi:hypothetical protein